MESNPDLANKLQTVLHHEIPLSRDIGIRVVAYEQTSLILQAPLANNINHKQTAFGGSLYSVAVLSGWGLLYLLLEERGIHAHIVIHESQVKYHKPVQGDIVARASLLAAADLERMVKLFHRSGMARINLYAEIRFDDELAVEFHGQYVIHR